MKIKMTFLAVFLLFAGCFGACDAIDCYSCSFSSSCGDPFNTDGAQTMTCASGEVCQAQSVVSGGSMFYTRSCTEPDVCSPGCISTPQGDICSYCCEEDLCNSEAIADVVADILHCYFCAYSSDPSAANISSPACNDPFDPNGDGVIQLPCSDGQCGVLTTNYAGMSTVSRLCFQDTNDTACTPGCDALNITCQTCCSDNLCNGGVPPFMSTTPSSMAAPSAFPWGKTSYVAAILLTNVALLVASG